MKLVYTELHNSMDIKPGQPCEWIIESPQFFTEVVKGLLNQKNGMEGKFTLSDADKILDVSKNIEIVVNPLAVDINDKRIINKLYMQLTEMAYSESFYVKTQEIVKKIYEYMFELEHESSHILSVSEEMDLNMLFKAAGIKYEVFGDDFLDTICRYMKIVREVLGIKLIVCVNLRSYLTDEQMNMLIDDINYGELGLLLIENQERSCLRNVRRCIIDKDLCEI